MSNFGTAVWAVSVTLFRRGRAVTGRVELKVKKVATRAVRVRKV